MAPNGAFSVSSHVRSVGLVNSECDTPFNEIVTNEIIQMNDIAVTDASVKDREMGGVWIISNAQRETFLEHRTHHKRWNNNYNVTAEALTLLGLIKVIEKKSRNMSEGRIVISLDYRQACKKIVKNIVKNNHIVGDGGS